MSRFKITDNNGKAKAYVLTSYDVDIQEISVVLQLNSEKFSVSYELKTDMVFSTVDSIIVYLEKIMKKVEELGYTLNVNEYFERNYVGIGYETDEEFEDERFTASKLF